MKQKIIFCLSDIKMGGVENILNEILTGLIKTTLHEYTILVANTYQKGILSDTILKNVRLECLNQIPDTHPTSFFAKKLHKAKRKHYIRTNAKRLAPLFQDADCVIDFKNGDFPIRWEKVKGPRKVIWFHLSAAVAQKYAHKWRFDAFDKIVCVSNHFVEQFQADFPHLSDRVSMIYNPFDFAKIQQKAMDEMCLSASDKALIKQPYFVHVARLSGDKDLTTLIEAYEAYAQKESHPTKLYLIGEGPRRTELAQKIQALHQEQNILLLGERKNPFIWIKNAKALILSSYNEGLPSVLIEAMVCSTPVIASNCPSGPAEILENGKLGALFTPGNAVELADILMRFERGDILFPTAKQIETSLHRFDKNQIIPKIETFLDKTPTVSVVMPVFNTRGDYLKQAIDSILAQTYRDFELIIYDDGSTYNDTIEVLQSYTDPRIQLIRNEQNKGISVARNTILQKARGSYIALMDSDDISLPTRLEKQVAYLDKHPQIGVCGSNIIHFPAGTQTSLPIHNKAIKRTLLRKCCIACPTVMLRGCVLKKHHITFNSDYQVAQDYRLWADLIDKTDFYNFPEPVLKYRMENQNISFRKASVCEQDTNHVKAYLRTSSPAVFGWTDARFKMETEPKTTHRFKKFGIPIKTITQKSLIRVYVLGLQVYRKRVQ